MQHAPKINRQYDNFTNVLKLYKSRNPTNSIPPILPHSSPNLNNNNNILISHTDPAPNIPVLHHQASPQITQRINNLLSNARISNTVQGSNRSIDVPISQRLRSSRQNNLPCV